VVQENKTIPTQDGHSPGKQEEPPLAAAAINAMKIFVILPAPFLTADLFTAKSRILPLETRFPARFSKAALHRRPPTPLPGRELSSEKSVLQYSLVSHPD